MFLKNLDQMKFPHNRSNGIDQIVINDREVQYNGETRMSLRAIGNHTLWESNW